MKRATCTAIAEGNRIQFIIGKDEPGYDVFASILKHLDLVDYQGKRLSWYGDVRDADGQEQSGLIITYKTTS